MMLRREFLKAALRFGSALAALPLLQPLIALAAERNAAAFSAKSLNDVVKAFGGAGAKESADILITAPEIAENGAVVPVAVESKLAGTVNIAILIEKNPDILSARFDIPAGTDAYVSTRVKVAETGNVIALVQTADGYFYAQKPVKVTLGGCGG
jgi:sulfur-oxidizing protein SoxY